MIEESKRFFRDLTSQERTQIEKQREQITAEMPDLIERDRMRKKASIEATLTGELRRAIHANPAGISDIAKQIGVSLIALDEFLTGEKTLRSDVLDRLVQVLGCEVRLVAS